MDIETLLKDGRTVSFTKGEHFYQIEYDSITQLINTVVDYAYDNRNNLDLFDAFDILKYLSGQTLKEITGKERYKIDSKE